MTLNQDREKILNMVASGKLSTKEALELLQALGEGGASERKDSQAPQAAPKYLRVLVEGSDGGSPQTVNIRVPIQLLYAGVKLAGLIPAAAHGPINKALKENGINLDVSQLKTSDLESLVTHLAEFQVDVDQKDQKVRIFCE